ncbi:MAG: methyltransferase type 11 [Candidatus Magnetoglobus multicellularis str. Araruama]|uniref:Methyltransferase type 11 n=1 Tax=Candidatus Magnetoglobus multicellularis str. Araruama TaxID=890399 RepID=A0A1V1P9H2_9BACT|nr:MAG: methyltransferase type 11 [Candidatus Magnetoglobus multicellularis str. Araruama]
MKYSIIPETKEDEKKLERYQQFLPAIDTSIPLIISRSIMAGVRLNIFDTIGHDSVTSAELSQSLSFNEESLTLLLNVLTGAGYIIFDNAYYRLSDISKKLLLRSSSDNLCVNVEYAYLRWKMIDQLEDVIQTGKGVDLHESFLNNPESWHTYQRSMFGFAKTIASQISPLVPVKPNAKKLLDIGGSHGLMGAEICKLHPPMTSTVFDLPDAIAQAQKIGKSEGLDDYVSYQAGDALADELGSNYDVVFVGNLMHHFSEEQNKLLIQKITKALSPNGTLAIYDVGHKKSTSFPDVFEAATSLMFHINSSGKCYLPEEYINWLTSAGFVDCKSYDSLHGIILVSGIYRQ